MILIFAGRTDAAQRVRCVAAQEAAIGAMSIARPIREVVAFAIPKMILTWKRWISWIPPWSVTWLVPWTRNIVDVQNQMDEPVPDKPTSG